ncbi:MAG: hypothetical protein Homavirus11_3 [Homavirus sp.]|uniref:Uncharacterized protein n=1 Tax=Homavirus sp. TaxID=2487769 RepID=A0A3G5A4L0_9VIRU|nr:MAG: hypothetical protein Homavirus11_3 [Homavirus sp.]
MDSILNFNKIYGDQMCDNLFTYMLDNNIYDEFFDSYNNYNKLFKFGLRYGIFEIIEYLYVHKGVSYDTSMFNEFYMNLSSCDEVDPNKVAIEGSGIHTGLHISKMDKYTKNRNQCINYLLKLRKYSVYKYVNKKHIYTFNKKYISMVI